MNFIEALETQLIQFKSPEYAIKCENYMKNNFRFLGINTNQRRTILKILWQEYKTEIKLNYRKITWLLFNKNEREFHYCGMEILIKEINKNYKEKDIQLIKQFIITNSWWDTVDLLSKYLLGNYLIQYPSKTLNTIELFSNDKNMWLNRSAILFQLSYKTKTNFDLLKSECEKHKESKAFFIQKAIGWALRDYGRFNPQGVKEYVLSTNLKPLSHREALRKII
jgi:3-methyladenine DNA glycosylase AlkD